MLEIRSGTMAMSGSLGGLEYLGDMLAALITDKKTLELIDFGEPEPRADQIVVEITYCGICGTDIHAYQTPGPAHPATCGHEWVGTISDCGRDVTRLQEGDRVVVGVPPSCGTCSACLAGQMTECSTVLRATVGRGDFESPYGGFATRLAVHHARAILANPALTDEQAAQIEPATICFHAVRATSPNLGDVAVVQGAGPIGLNTIQWALTAGAAKVIVVEPSETRRKLARDLGAYASIEPGEIAQVFINDHTHGLGADIVYECAGVPTSVQSAVDLTRRGGRMCLIGLATAEVRINPRSWLLKEIKVSAALGFTHEEFDIVMSYVAEGRIDLDTLHSGTVSLNELDAMLSELSSGTSLHTKVLVDPRR